MKLKKIKESDNLKKIKIFKEFEFKNTKAIIGGNDGGKISPYQGLHRFFGG